MNCSKVKGRSLAQTGFRIVFGALIFSVCAMNLSAGGKQSAGGAKGPSAVTVWMGSWWEDQVPALVNAYKPAAPDVSLVIETLPINGYFDKAAATILAGDGPDLLAVDVNQMGTFIQQNLLLPWDDQIQGLDLSDFVGVIKGGIYNGKYYGLPYRASGNVLYYNRTMFDAAGVPYPKEGWTYNDMLEIARRLTKGTQEYGYGVAASRDDTGNVFQTFGPVVYWQGADYLNPQQTAPTLNTPEFIKAVQFWTDLYTKEKVVPQGTINYTITRDVMPLFIENKVAMFIGGDQNAAEFKKYPNLKFGFVVPPKSPVAMGGYFFTVPVTAKNKQGAFDFAKWFLQPENLGNLTIRIPARLKAVQYGVWNDPIYQTVLQGAMDGRLAPTVTQWPAIQNIIIVELQNIMQRQKTVEQACADMQRQAAALF
jgi:multiple sugar transport system substrate-binding protein